MTDHLDGCGPQAAEAAGPTWGLLVSSASATVGASVDMKAPQIAQLSPHATAFLPA